MAIILGFLLILAGFILFTATVRVQAFRRSLRVGLFTFVIPCYGWWYGFARYTGKLRLPLMLTVLVCYVVGGVVTYMAEVQRGLQLHYPRVA